ncbi:ARM repeat-containing protein [Sistotremastrum niveocremeum HHB9708]|uniref:ARM repeat-containing protein n=1 Tax=Sistotremastrum niveocremeum HHB9708 TaxID=1314777 RepID=A0A164UB70_9AGAM|nr:ARM repeat-containing protein [Sistotremastrum niveocremeum HHB9708]
MDGLESHNDETLSGTLTPTSDTEARAQETLQTYLDALPYKAESTEEMHQHLEFIVGRIAICVKTKDWRALSSWDGMLQCWLLMKYPMAKPIRAKLVRLYYELVLIPGIDTRLMRGWADMMQRLLALKEGSKRKLQSSDLKLPWRPLWRVLQKELWPKKHNAESTRNAVNILLFVAEQGHRYYPSEEIPDMLECFLSRFNKDTVLTIIPVITSFLPPRSPHSYLPVIFKLWEATNSSIVDDRFLEMIGSLAEEYVSGVAGAEGCVEWKDVGIFTQEQWTFLVGKCLGSFNVPVANMRGSSNTGALADTGANRASLRIKKNMNRLLSLARIIVYSMSVDGPIRKDDLSQGEAFVAGSKAVHSLDMLITSTESFFHPSNHGAWSLTLTSFIKHVSAEFLKRWKEEEQKSCKTPVTQRLTPAIKRSVVVMLRTPSLLAVFSKDPFATAFSQQCLRSLAILEPNIVMPHIIERAIGGLEVVNETHRTTAVLGLLSAVSLPLVSEQMWFGGQKHLLGLLDLALPGIDMNDPGKTIMTAMFIMATMAHVKLGQVTPATHSLPDDVAAMDEDVPPEETGDLLPDTPTLSRDEERALVRDATSEFEGWVTGFFRQIFKLFENLPEEGGRSNKTGGKQEEAALSTIKTALDVVCLHLSDQIFDSVLRLTYEYARSNARANSVRAFGQLVGGLSRVQPQKTIDLFLPFCAARIEEELAHGASSVRTTSSHAANPSDTVLHWNLAILRAALGYGGPALLKHKAIILSLLSSLVLHTKSERGFSGAGRLLVRILHTIAGTYTQESRWVDDETWNDPNFNAEHCRYWGKYYEAKDVPVTWHIPSDEEISFVIEILNAIGGPALDTLESLLPSVNVWDNVARNDFCRYLHAVRSLWNGLPSILLETEKIISNPCIDNETELPELLARPLKVNAGFILSDPKDPRYQTILAHRTRFGEFLHASAVALRQSATEDHIDAVIQVCRGIDMYLLEYATSRSSYGTISKTYQTARDGNRLWTKQKESPRIVFVKRAQHYHHGRQYMHSLYRSRSKLDDHLLDDLVEMSLSRYTRVRKYGQSLFFNVCSYYVRSTRYCLPMLLDALAPGSDPDRMKGALHTLGNKAIASYALSDRQYSTRFIEAILECSHQDKNSIQELVKGLISECVSSLTEEASATDSARVQTPSLDEAVDALSSEFSPNLLDQILWDKATSVAPRRLAQKEAVYGATVECIIRIATMPTTHWKYAQYALRILSTLLRRDLPPNPQVAKLFMTNVCSPETTTRTCAQRAIIQILKHVKMRTFSRGSLDTLWLEEYRNPLARTIQIHEPSQFLASLHEPVTLDSEDNIYVDKITSGFALWGKTVKGYVSPKDQDSSIIWETESLPALDAIRETLVSDGWLERLAVLWSQESNRTQGNIDPRSDNFTFIKKIAKLLGDVNLDRVLSLVEELIADSDRYKQRAGAELLHGYSRGSKHWPRQAHGALLEWIMHRVPTIFSQIRPDTRNLWETWFSLQVVDRDPRRTVALTNWIQSIPLEFNGDSAFAMSKSLSLFGIFAECAGPRYEPFVNEKLDLLFDNANTSYAEIREQIAVNIDTLIHIQWRPGYRSVTSLMEACRQQSDPFQIRRARHLDRVETFVKYFPQWREERLPAPRVSQSQYDKTGLTLLQWIWNTSHGAHAPSLFPYVLPLIPEILRMSELSDNPELIKYSVSVLFILSAVTPPHEMIEPVANTIMEVIKTSTSWKVRHNALPALIVFFYRNLPNFSQRAIQNITEILVVCLSDENVEVRTIASKVFSGVVRCSQRSQIPSLRKRFLSVEAKTTIPPRSDPNYASSLRTLHSAILGLCALVECFPYVVEKWMPPLMEVLARHSTDPPPISATIRSTASEFKKTHQDTWQHDVGTFDEDQLQALQTMLIGTSYYA